MVILCEQQELEQRVQDPQVTWGSSGQAAEALKDSDVNSLV